MFDSVSGPALKHQSRNVFKPPSTGYFTRIYDRTARSPNRKE